MRTKKKQNFNVTNAGGAAHNSTSFLRRQELSGISNVSVTNDNLTADVKNVGLTVMGTVLGAVVLYLLFRGKIGA
jgi:hypothetical protein